MLVSLLITAFAATATAMDAATFYSMLNYAFKPLIIIEVLVAIGASYFIGKKNVAAAAVMYLAYTIMNGVTMSVIFYAFDLSSIQQVFLTTAILFGVMAGIGAVTKKDLTNERSSNSRNRQRRHLYDGKHLDHDQRHVGVHHGSRICMCRSRPCAC